MMIVTKDYGFCGQVTVDPLLRENVVVLVDVPFLGVIKMVNVFLNRLKMIFKMASILQL